MHLKWLISLYTWKFLQNKKIVFKCNFNINKTLNINFWIFFSYFRPNAFFQIPNIFPSQIVEKHRDPRLCAYNVSGRHTDYSGQMKIWPMISLGKRDFTALYNQFQDIAAFALQKNSLWITFKKQVNYTRRKLLEVIWFSLRNLFFPFQDSGFE